MTTEASLFRPAADPVKALRSVTVTPIALLADEPCWWLFETDLPSRNSRGKSRYQLVRVVRGDRLATAYVHIGPSSKFKADPFFFPSEGVHTVGEAMDAAEEMRHRPLRREMEPSDLQGAFQTMTDEKKRRRTHQSTFGSGVMKVRP